MGRGLHNPKEREAVKILCSKHIGIQARNNRAQALVFMKYKTAVKLLKFANGRPIGTVINLILEEYLGVEND